MMLAVLRSLYAQAGATCPTAALAQLDDVGTRHLNWTKVMGTLKAAYAVDVWDADSDRKALIVGGSARPECSLSRPARHMWLAAARQAAARRSMGAPQLRLR